jgi:tetratricopeptide (TPR) repeat protein
MIAIRQKLLRQNGRWADAIKDVDRLIAVNSDVSDFYKWRAEAYEHLNNKQKAQEDIARAKHIDEYGQ